MEIVFDNEDGIRTGSIVYRRQPAEVSHMRPVRAAGLLAKSRERYGHGVQEGKGRERDKSRSTYSSARMNGFINTCGWTLARRAMTVKGITCSLLLLLFLSWAFFHLPRFGSARILVYSSSTVDPCRWRMARGSSWNADYMFTEWITYHPLYCWSVGPFSVERIMNRERSMIVPRLAQKITTIVEMW